MARFPCPPPSTAEWPPNTRVWPLRANSLKHPVFPLSIFCLFPAHSTLPAQQFHFISPYEEFHSTSPPFFLFFLKDLSPFLSPSLFRLRVQGTLGVFFFWVFFGWVVCVCHCLTLLGTNGLSLSGPAPPAWRPGLLFVVNFQGFPVG